jgi:membrane protein required for colicin V production
MSSFDAISLILIGVLGIRSAFRGFIKEIFSFVGIVMGIISARLYCHQAAEFFSVWIKNEYIASALGFALILFFIIIAMGAVSWIVFRIIKHTMLNPANHIAGFFVGAIQGMLIAGLFVLVVNGIAGSIDNSFLKSSFMAHPLLGFMKFISGIVLPKVIPGHVA